MRPTVCRRRVSGSLSLPSRGSFHLSFTVLCSIGHWAVFSLAGWSPLIPPGFLVSRRTLDTAAPLRISGTGLSPSPAGFPKAVPLCVTVASAVLTPRRHRRGLGSSRFARRYSGNRCFFLFLRLLRCFSSPGSPPCVMDSRTDTWALPMWVSPFRHLRIFGYLPLPAAFRSLLRLSSAPSAKASALRPVCLTCPFLASCGIALPFRPSHGFPCSFLFPWRFRSCPLTCSRHVPSGSASVPSSSDSFRCLFRFFFVFSSFSVWIFQGAFRRLRIPSNARGKWRRRDSNS